MHKGSSWPRCASRCLLSAAKLVSAKTGLVRRIAFSLSSPQVTPTSVLKIGHQKIGPDLFPILSTDT